MQTLKIEIQINLKDAAQLKRVQDFLNSIEELNGEVPDSSQDEEEKKPKKKTQTKTTKKVIEKSVESEKESSDDSEYSDYTIDDVRSLLAKKVKSSRVKIKAKLNDLGVKNVSTMDESDYPDFMEFLEGLDD